MKSDRFVLAVKTFLKELFVHKRKQPVNTVLI